MKRINLLLDEAYQQQLNTGNADAHKSWVEVLLVEYYDPMYDYQLENKADKIRFRGDAEAVLKHIRQLG